ncbi:hypothetical protein KPH14_001169 [Odynerus spinipes]|uniref:CN hydrolase domain-containing protein n=1 Tax=Odynerus spinipes TaxID=1348599 RepID=A0AAD9RR81_9HYME|nr:hypothetical protein KPH14_001169 [Odynerus spinipes]
MQDSSDIKEEARSLGTSQSNASKLDSRIGAKFTTISSLWGENHHNNILLSKSSRSMGEVTSNNMNWRWIFLYLLIAYIRSSSQASTPASKSYVAAVVEFSPKFFANDSKATLNSNIPLYVKNIENAKQQNADIIVFPEDGLTSYHLPLRNELGSWTTVIPAPADKYTPCSQNMNGVSEALKNISCAAQKNKIYVVINLPEKSPCTGEGCPKDNVFYYNTNVVFDRNGTIIARYRKVNLFTEPGFDVTKEPEIVTFDTDFGVKFGTFICFDILFATPPLNLTKGLGVTDIVYSTAWFSETPFLTAIQAQAGWSYAEDVNFLASGYNNPARGSAGSGIYLGRAGIKKAIMPLRETTALLVEEVPKKVKRTVSSTMQTHEMKHTEHSHEHVHDEFRRKRENFQLSDLKLLRDNLEVFNTEPLKGNVSTKQLCHNNFCCDFTIRVSKIDPKVHYRIVVFNGIRNYANVRSGATRVCAVVQCSNDTVESCGSIASSTTTFDEIGISGKFDDSLNSLIMPTTLSTTLLPLEDGWSYHEHAHDSHKHVSLNSNKTMSNLLTFGVYCRDYDKDNSNAASSTAIYSLSAFMAFLLSRFL